MGWSCVEDKIVAGHRSVSRLSKEFAEMEPAPGDRNLNDGRAAKIKAAIVEGRFRTGDFASAYCKETDQTYRVNGKHQSKTLAAMNGECPEDIKIHLARYEADTLADVADLYATFDARWSTRTPSDINRAFAGSVEELHGISSRIVNLAVVGINFASRGHETYNVPPEVRAIVLREYPGFVVWLHKIIGHNTKESRYLKRSATVAAMFSTWQRSHKAAEQFWQLVVSAEGPDRTSADRVLNWYLVTHSLRSGAIGGGSTGAKSETARAMYVKCIHAWNAWRKGTKTELKYFPAADIPKAI